MSVFVDKRRRSQQRRRKRTVHQKEFGGVFDGKGRGSCGVSCVVDLNPSRAPSRETLRMLLNAHRCQQHRGAQAADVRSGDGAGVSVTLPRMLYEKFLALYGVQVTDADEIGVGTIFFPRDSLVEKDLRRRVENVLRVKLGNDVVYRWRFVPIDSSKLGEVADNSRPSIAQLVIVQPSWCRLHTSEHDPKGRPGHWHFEYQLFLVRKAIEQIAEWKKHQAYFCSLSCRALVLKGLVTGRQLEDFYLDLENDDFRIKAGIAHERFATNTASDWRKAQPFRGICHNGEITTLYGNQAYMDAWQEALRGNGWDHLLPFYPSDTSDSGVFDAVFELFRRTSDKPMEHVLAIMMPSASQAFRDFWRFQAGVMPPFDGPAAIVCFEGWNACWRQDRNGLRPARWIETTDRYLIAASEIGVVPVEPSRIKRTGQLGPGESLFADAATGTLEVGAEVIERLAAVKNHTAACKPLVQPPHNLKAVARTTIPSSDPSARPYSTMLSQAVAYGWDHHDVHTSTRAMILEGRPLIRAMGDDVSLAVLSENGQPLARFFKQLFAEVTGPPIASDLEPLVVDLSTIHGRKLMPFGTRGDLPTSLELPTPVLSHEIFGWMLRQKHVKVAVLDATYRTSDGDDGLKHRLTALREAASAEIRNGAEILIISDRNIGHDRRAVPILLAIGAINEHLVRTGERVKASLSVESGEVRDDHLLAALLSYGAASVYPYALLDIAEWYVQTSTDDQAIKHRGKAESRVLAALEKGLVKIMAKIGITTVSSYIGSRLFECYGLDADLVKQCFGPTPSKLGGIGLRRIAQIYRRFHQSARRTEGTQVLPDYGLYAYDPDTGEVHTYSPALVRAIHQLTGVTINGKAPNGRPTAAHRQAYNEAASRSGIAALQHLFTHTPAGKSIPVEEVDGFDLFGPLIAAGSISDGSISEIAHITHAMALNAVGGRSSAGEGGISHPRLTFQPFGRWAGKRRFDRFPDPGCAEVQIASGRFGVHALLLAQATWVQIKMAQGAKPGEGGHLRSIKVTFRIGNQRFCIPGIELVSPAPMHDIYSIEELWQLIYDIRAINPTCEISVKLVVRDGIGTIAVGCVKAGATGIHVAGGEGGTGASPYTSIMNAGGPWVIGLKEVHEALVAANLRDHATITVDGGIKTAHDILVAWKLGAQYISLGTILMIAAGCVKTNRCDKGDCPVGYATQRPELVEKFPGRPEHIITFLRALCEDVRELMARDGIRHFQDVMGRVDLLQVRNDCKEAREYSQVLDLQKILWHPEDPDGWHPPRIHKTRNRLRPVQPDLDYAIYQVARDLFESGVGSVTAGPYYIRNINRSVGGRLSNKVVLKFGLEGLNGKLFARFVGYAGQSFGVWLARGLVLELTGFANDFVGKGLSGGRVIIKVAVDAAFDPRVSALAGNAIGYGGTAGEIFIGGCIGQRGFVRNSGVTGVIAGAGNHLCEYQTRGRVVCLSCPGFNVGAGMAAGELLVFDRSGEITRRCNGDWVQAKPLENQAIHDHVFTLLRRYHTETAFPTAGEILADPTLMQHFWLVESIRPRIEFPEEPAPTMEALHAAVERLGYSTLEVSGQPA